MSLPQTIRRRIDELLLVTIVVISAGAALAVVVDLRAGTKRAHVSQEFQSLLGGLGMGCHADLAHCSWQFDPRLMGDDDAPLDVVLGAGDYNPWHAISLFPVPSGAFGDLDPDQNGIGDVSAPTPQSPAPKP
jgi:hypothetical protein